CASDDGEISIFIANGDIARGVSIGNFAPVKGVASRVAIDCTEHMRKGASEHQQSTFVWRKFVALGVHNFSDHTGERLSCLGRTRSDYRQCAEAGTAGFRLPPIVGDKTPFTISA